MQIFIYRYNVVTSKTVVVTDYRGSVLPIKTRIMSPANPHDALHHGERAANK